MPPSVINNKTLNVPGETWEDMNISLGEFRAFVSSLESVPSEAEVFISHGTIVVSWND
jgi:hypothetical protein